MGLTEILLIISGIAIFIASFLVPEKFAKENPKAIKFQEEKIKELVELQVKQAAFQIEEKTEETMTAAMEKTERYMERLTNEKMMAVQEYSDTVLGQINRNHEEAVFLYDMLNNKHVQVKNTAAEINHKVMDAKVNYHNTIQEQIVEFPYKKIEEMNMQEEEKTENIFEYEEFANVKKDTSIRKKEEDVVEVDILAEANEESGSNKEKILKLHQEGKTNMEIAKNLGMGVGEVKLIIGLFENGQ